MPVSATGILRATGGVGQFELQSATVAGLPVPTFVLQQIVSNDGEMQELNRLLRLTAAGDPRK